MGTPGAGKSMLRKYMLNTRSLSDICCLSSEKALIYALKKKSDDLIIRLALKILPKKLTVKYANTILNSYRSQVQVLSCFLADYGASLTGFIQSRQYRNKAHDEKWLAISRYFKIALWYQLINNEIDRRTIVVFDGGFLQKSMSLFLSPGSKENRLPDKELLHYLGNIPLPKIAVWVNSTTESCYQRLLSRPRGLTLRLGKMDRVRITDFLIECQDFFRRIACHVEENGVKVIRVDNEGNPDEVFLKLANMMSSVFFEMLSF